MSPEQWRERGLRVDTRDGAIFALDLGEERAATPALVLHGFPTSSWDFESAAIDVAHDRRVVLFDFLGFGFSDKPAGAAYSLFEQADVAIAVARAHGLQRVHLWTHDMGTSVATELLARRERGLLPFEIASVVFMNGSVHIGMASPTVGQRLLRSPIGNLFARASSKRTFVPQIRRVFAKKPDAETTDGMWELLSRDDGALRLPKIIGYMKERARFERRWVGALTRADVPVLVAWGEKDPVAVLAIAERIARETPGAELVTWPDLGHYPQVEDPTRVAATIGRFFGLVDGRGAA